MEDDRGISMFDIIMAVFFLLMVSVVVVNLSSPKPLKEISITEAETDFNNTVKAVSKSLMLNSNDGRTKVSIRNYLPIRGIDSDRNKFFFMEFMDPNTGVLNSFSNIKVAVVNHVALAGVDIDLLSDSRNGVKNYNIQRRSFINKQFAELQIPTLIVDKDSTSTGFGLHYTIPDDFFQKRYLNQTFDGFFIPKDKDTYVSGIIKESF